LPALALGCGTQGATPLPEPPALAPDKITPRTDFIAPASWPTTVGLQGIADAATPGALVRVTNLDRQEPPIVTSSNSDGSFTLAVVTSPGDELRLEADSNGVRSAPVDFVFDMTTLTPSVRFSCVTIEPGLELPFAGRDSRTFSISNRCSTPLTVQSASERLSLPDFTLTTTLPLGIPAGDSATFSVAFNRSSTGPREDVLFLTLADGASVLRYPITLYTP
jgi:hypothetical protein